MIRKNEKSMKKNSVIRKLLAAAVVCMMLTGCGADSTESISDNTASEEAANLEETANTDGAVDTDKTTDADTDENTNTNADETGNTDDANASGEAAADVSWADSQEGDASGGSAEFSGKSFVITLYPEIAPITCENFQKLVEQGFYNGLTFHRVVEDFMAQGGAPLGNENGGSEETIKGEFATNGVDNAISHQRGVISMARSADPDSASSQFFICYSDACVQLDGDYAAFGEVTEGMEVVDAFLEVPRTTSLSGEPESAPTVPITIDKAVMGEKDANGNSTVIITMK